MKKLFTLSIAWIFCSVFSNAQTPLPYYTGFDNANQKSGWVEFRTGYASVSKWTYSGFGSFSAPECLHHDYPVGSAGTDTTIDWYVSPPFNFNGGGTIDSLKVNIYSITGGNTPVDELSIYLLSGSNNPSMASSITLLGALKDMVSGNTAWLDTGNFIIPQTPGTSYVGIKYQATNNWFVANLDNINISGSAAGIGNYQVNENAIRIFPLPADDKLNVSIMAKPSGKIDLALISLTGKILAEKRIDKFDADASFDISMLEPGPYMIRLTGSDFVINRSVIVLRK